MGRYKLQCGMLAVQMASTLCPTYESLEERNVVQAPKPLAQVKKKYNRTISSSIESAPQDRASTESLDGQNSYRLVALERALGLDPLPLLSFATRHDFTAENIIFLMQVREWRRAWQNSPRDQTTGILHAESLTDMLHWAVNIYTNSVCLDTACYPINIDHDIYKYLQQCLKPYQSSDLQESKSADGDISRFLFSSELDLSKICNAEKVARPVQPVLRVTNFALNEHLFDAAETSIKHLVLYNTWRRFVEYQETK